MKLGGDGVGGLRGQQASQRLWIDTQYYDRHAQEDDGHAGELGENEGRRLTDWIVPIHATNDFKVIIKVIVRLEAMNAYVCLTILTNLNCCYASVVQKVIL